MRSDLLSDNERAVLEKKGWRLIQCVAASPPPASAIACDIVCAPVQN